MTIRNRRQRAKDRPSSKGLDVFVDPGRDHVALHQLNDDGTGTESVYIAVGRLDETIAAMRRAGAVVRAKAPA